MTMYQENIVECESHKDKLLDLSGMHFGSLDVIEYNKDKKKWLCKCKCGNTVYKRSWDLRNGKATTCGCIKGGSFRREDLTGKKCGYLTPIKYLGEHQWECICDCGRTTIKTQTQLKNPDVSCGCKLNQNKREDLTGLTFGKLTVKKYINYSKYECECSCDNHNIRIVSANDLKQHKITECEQCTRDRLQKTYRSNRIDLTDKEFGDLKVIGYNQKAHKWICKCNCGKTIEVYGQHLRSGDTRSCGCKYGLKNNKYRSYLELEIFNYIKSIYHDEIIQNHRGILGDNKEIDIYLPDIKIGIEVNGTYWHNDEIVNEITYHQNKVIDAHKNGVRLIHIYEYEWRNKQEVIQKYIKSQITNNHNIIYARKTTICEENNSDVKDFLNNNHIQGYTNASINIALKYDNKIVALMSFDKPRFNKECQYELIRLAFDNDVIVVGGTQKMLNYFVKKYSPSSIISYCNIDKFQGNTYDNLKFNMCGITRPNYVWVNKHNDVLSRYQTQKYRLVEQGLGTENQTEDEIMHSLGYNKIYNSGNLKFMRKWG